MNTSNHQEFLMANGNDEIIIFIHGILGSPGRFRGLAEELSGQGFDCMALLLPGHGGTSRAFYRTRSARWPEYVKRRVREAAQQYKRVYLVGHSLGGLISLDCAAEGPIAGVVLINTPLAFKLSLKQMAFSMRIILSPPGGDDPFLSAYRQDFSVSGTRLLEYPLWLRQFFGLFRYIRQTRGRLKDVKARALIVQSMKDESVQRRSARMLKSGLVNADAEVVELNDSYHGYFPERDRQILLDSISMFMAS